MLQLLMDESRNPGEGIHQFFRLAVEIPNSLQGFFSSQVFFFPEFPSIQTVPNEVIVDSVVRAIVDRPLGSSLELSTGEVSMVGRCFTTVDGGPMLHHRCIKISSSVESKMSTKT